MEAALSSGGPTFRCGVFHMEHLLCCQSRSAANEARGKIQCCQVGYPFSSRWKHYLSRVAQFVAIVDFFTGGSEEKVEGWLGEV